MQNPAPVFVVAMYSTCVVSDFWSDPDQYNVWSFIVSEQLYNKLHWALEMNIYISRENMQIQNKQTHQSVPLSAFGDIRSLNIKMDDTAINSYLFHVSGLDVNQT